jgi:hypothetical protein
MLQLQKKLKKTKKKTTQTLTFLEAVLASGESKLGDFRLLDVSGSSLKMLCCGWPAIGVWKFRGLGNISEELVPLAPNDAPQSEKKVDGDGSISPGKNRLGSAESGV